MNDNKSIYQVDTDEPILLVQIALVIMLISWPVSAIVGVVNLLSDYNLDGVALHILVWPILLVGMLTLNGTPTKKKWVEEGEDYER